MGGMANGLGLSPMGGAQGGFLSNLLGGLPDPLGIGKLLGLTGQQGPQGPQGPPPGAPPPPPQGTQFAPQQSGVSQGTANMGFSPMGPNGFRVGGG